ncbi:MAG: hypothetical protein ACYS9X_15675, partial [Planctomycetota bacterium]|jgi:hypothetical protein
VLFYSRVRPFGLWGPVREEAEKAGLEPLVGPARSPGRIVLNVCLWLCLLVGLYYGAFLLVGHYWGLAAAWLGAAVVSAVCLYHTWYRPIGELAAERGESTATAETLAVETSGTPGSPGK